MKQGFEIGDKVSLIDENLNGTVKAITDNRVLVTIEDGFDLEVNLLQIVPCRELNFSIGNINNIKREKNENTKPKKRSKSPKKKTYIEFDLHIDKLHPDWKTLDKSNYLNYQVSAAQGKLDFAIKKRIPHFVFIHGVGEGVLKQELYTILGRYDFLIFEDAPYYKYGLGATLVRYKL
ncbi:MAG: DNA mismatch repair protein MutS [Flavobacteriaceae bacterium]|nr:DNA mismatch repair protein MutS [Flavobacteriaceae bacterium]